MDLCDAVLPIVAAFQSAIDLAFSFFSFLGVSSPDIYDAVSSALGC
jgi:hypothetical protein